MKISKPMFVRCFSGEISYKRAFVLSVFFHGLIFFLLVLLLNPLHLSKLEKIPLIIDFVSTPGDEARGVSPPSEKHVFDQNFNETKVVPARFFSNASLTQANEDQSITNESDKASQVSRNKMNSKYIQPYLASVFVPPSVKFPRVEIAEPKLMPAKMPISERHEQTLLKQVTKLTEKLIKKELVDTTIFVRDRDQQFEIQVLHLPAKSTTELDEILFEITTERDGKLLSTQMRMKRLAFSNFAQLVDYWDPRVAVHDDVFEGRFHTNYAFSVSRSKGIGPQFLGKVTTAAYDVKTSGDFPIIDQNTIFIGGIETGTKQIQLPKTFSLFSDQSKLAHEQVHVLTGETWIIFQKNGYYTWQSKTLPGIERRNKIPGTSFFIIGKKGAKIHVKGTVAGKVLVYSADGIIIDDDLFYARPPEEFSNSDDYLGLVSERNIEIAHPSVTGSGDLHVYAAIYARGWFRIPNLYGSGEATLFIYGSLSAGSLTATEPRYATHVRFDKRLEFQRPPNFPVTDRYEVVDWERAWKINK